MTISEAIASEIQPFSTSDEAIEKMFIDAADKYTIQQVLMMHILCL